MSKLPLYKLFIWRKEPFFFTCAHATSIAQARKMIIEDQSGDFSTPIRNQAIEFVKAETPEIFYKEVNELIITDSAECIEMENTINRLTNKIKTLENEIERRKMKDISKIF